MRCVGLSKALGRPNSFFVCLLAMAVCIVCGVVACRKLLEHPRHYRIALVHQPSGWIERCHVVMCGACRFEMWRDHRKLSTYASDWDGKHDMCISFPVAVQEYILGKVTELTVDYPVWRLSSFEDLGSWEL